MKSVRFVVWLLMLTLPMQGLAAFAPAARCADEHAAPAVSASQDARDGHHAAAGHGHDHPAPADHQHQNDGQPADQAGGHPCCHHVFSGAAQSATPGAQEAPRAVTLRVSLLSTLHIPELPQRPPRA